MKIRECLYLGIVLILFLSITIASASDVAYLYKKTYKIDSNVLNVFSELGLSVDKISDEQIPKTDFSKYRIIFVGDERFANQKYIPVDKISSVISNYYFGYEFGLTDVDGVSKLAATSPLSVNKNNKIIQVYTRATYSTSSISIPYYYLGDENKAAGMQPVARTYTGKKNGIYNFGDVISYADAGAKLTNGKTAQAKICFYGIIESDYWTKEARQMFKDCVSFVAMTCSGDSDCPTDELGDKYCSQGGVYQDIKDFSCQNPGTVQSKCVYDTISNFVKQCPYACLNGECIRCDENSDCNDDNANTEDTCLKPGTPESYCENKIINCKKNADCGTNGLLDKFCREDNVFGNFIDYICNNPGTSGAFCSNTTSSSLIETCPDICVNGKCSVSECKENSECSEDYYSGNYCNGTDVYRDFHDFSCSSWQCIEEIEKQKLETCDDVCFNGECRTITCCKNSECGTNGFSGNKYCLFGNSYEDFLSYTCNNPGTLDSFCSNYSLPILLKYCEGECISGECITCFNDLSCGNSTFIGDKYCIGNGVYQNYQNFYCKNPGMPESSCFSNTIQKLIKNCGQDVCILGECIPIQCYSDSECDDANPLTIDKCLNPGTKISRCTNTEVNCLNDDDCGINRFVGSEFCQSNDVFKYYQSSLCVNPGTFESYCNLNLIPKFLIDCGEDYCDDWENYCKDNNIYHSRNCYDKGCNSNTNGCFSSFYSEEELVEECLYGCENAECLPQCTDDDLSRCGEESFSELYCSGNNVTRNHTFPVCEENKCSTETIIETIETCDFKCENGGCIKGIHDVAISLNLDNSFNGIKITDSNGNPLLDSIPKLLRYQKYKIIFNVTNNGNYNEYVSYLGKSDCSGIGFTGYTSSLESGKSTKKEYTNNNATCIPGLYTLTITANITEDNNPEDNIRIRQFKVVECLSNSDCGSASSYLTCSGKNVVNVTTTPTCDENGICREITTNETIKTCDFLCENSECLGECSEDSDCGSDFNSSDYCFNNDVYYDFTDNFCREYSCLFSLSKILKQDCGEDEYSSFNYCKDNDVYENSTTINRGCASAGCYETINSEEILVQDCKEDEYSDYGERYCKGNDVYKNRTFYERGCSSVLGISGCFENPLIKEELVETCDDACENGECKTITCYENSDCGTDAFIGDYFCQNNDYVYKDKKIFTCENKGTPQSSCSSSTIPILVGECFFGCENGRCMACA